MKKTLITLALAGVTVAGLTGCATTSGSADGKATAVPTAGSGSSPSASSPAKATGPVALGTPWTYKDGLTVIAMDATPVTIHPGFDPEPGIAVTVQVQNKTAKAIDPYFQVAVTSGAAGQTASSGFDSGQGISGFEAPIPPGGTATAKYGFVKVVDPNVLTISVQPGFDYEPAFFKKG